MDIADEPRVAATSEAVFERWFVTAEPRLRGALVATFGADLGREAAAEALRYCWEHRERVLAMDNSIGYLFRLGQRWGRRQRSRTSRRILMDPEDAELPGFEPGLDAALRRLSTRQRQVVVLCHGFGLSHAEAAAVLDISRSSVQNHAERGLRHLRHALGAAT
jgi:DNA-directed RNA polymerase specialized sigma24 family protein